MQAVTPSRFLASEAQGLLTRLRRVRPLSATMPAVASASVGAPALRAIDQMLICQREDLGRHVTRFLARLKHERLTGESARAVQREFVFLKLRFNATLDQLDIFADVMTQRSEHETGSWIGGLDVAASDAMQIESYRGEMPLAVTYLDRGHGAAIRRARTRLPGGAPSPVAIVRIPRERMVGTGIASSLVHEAGHQVAGLLDLVASLRRDLGRARTARSNSLDPWELWQRWISEILADAWAIGKLGPAATSGLMGVVSLPLAFVFRVGLDGPHPFPWIRVVLSCRVGNTVYPDPIWSQLERSWRTMYPLDGAPAKTREIVQQLESTMDPFIDRMLSHRVSRANGDELRRIVRHGSRTPRALRSSRARVGMHPHRVAALSPTRALAYLGLARLDGALPAEQEHRLVGQLLQHWALSRALCDGVCARCAAETSAPIK
ncbi:MAG: hypothetical protein AAFX79_02990 [Planctomycetota bacterium]